MKIAKLNIEEKYNPLLTDVENAVNIGVDVSAIHRWRKANNITKSSKKLIEDKRIADMFNPELSDGENAEIIGVTPWKIREWRSKNKVSVWDNKKQMEYKKIESLYNPELTDEENAEIIGVKSHRIHKWRKDNPELVKKLHIGTKDNDWAVIENFPDYMVSRSGEIYSMKYGKILQPLKSIDGYVCYALTRNKKRYNVNIQKLVAEAFIPNPENKTIVIHIDGDKNNNVWTNLKWGYRSDSEKFQISKINNGLNRAGKKNPKLSKTLQTKYGIKVNQYTIGGEFVASYDSIGEASRILNIERRSIGACCQGRRKSAGGYIWMISPEPDNIMRAQQHKINNKSKNGNGSKKRKVNQYTLDGKFVASYNSISDAHKSTNAPVNNICQCCLGKSRTAGGYVWKYAEEI